MQLNGVSAVKVVNNFITVGAGSTLGTVLTGVTRTTYINDYNNNLSFFTLGSINAIYGGTLLQFNGATSSFPAIKRNGTGLDIRLADDSGYGAIQSLYDRFGSGSPESVVTAPVGAVYHRTDGGAGTSFYVKESGTGNTGWIAK